MDRHPPRRRGGRSVALLLAAAALGALPAATDGRGREVDDRPNVLLIVVDTLRRDHLGSYGYSLHPTTPCLDALAAQSLRFDRAYSSAPWTTASIGALLTSQYPTTLGIKEHRSALPAEFPLLSEALRRKGYATGAVISHRLCSARWHFDQGFESFDESNIKGHAGVTSAEVTDRAMEFLTKRRHKPFFLWVHYFDPHYVYIEHPEFPFPATPPYEGRIQSGHFFEAVRIMNLGADDIGELLRLYDSEVAYTDAHIGRLLDHLRALGQYENTMVIVTADHGEEFRDHGSLAHSKTLYDELVHVPLLMKVPGETPRVIAEEVSTVDLYPTVLELLGIEPIGELVGVPLLGREPGAARPAFFETAHEGRRQGLQLGRWKFIRNLDTGVRELYDTIADPSEQNDRVSDEPELVGQLDEVLDGWAERVSAREVHETLDVTDEERERLRALGYVD